MIMLKKIVIIGPESTGKSNLSEALANHYQTCWAKEFAREYLISLGREYTYGDLYTIAIGQLENEMQVLEKAEALLSTEKRNVLPVFVDTDLYVIKVWSEFVYNQCDNRILNLIANSHADLYLLCYPDLPWEEDALREYPDPAIRMKLFHHYRDAMINQDTPWVTITGEGSSRLQKAILAIDPLLQ
jgi:nicotinamide riboside kinase